MNTTASSSTSVRAILNSSIINLIVWFNWYIYAAFAIYFSASFFPEGSRTVQLLKAAGVFALGFLMRPIGSWILGSFADKKGRRKSMLLEVFLMSFGSLLIAIIPTHHQIGVWAPTALIFARLIQGISIGGGTGITSAYLSEMSVPGKRGFYASFQYATLVAGQILALGLLMLLQQSLLTERELKEWGWRIPFIIGSILSLFIIYLQKEVPETKAFRHITGEQKKNSIATLIRRHLGAVLTVVGLTLGGTIAFYTSIIYIQKYLVNTNNITAKDATLISFFGLLFFALIQPVFGALSDRIGRKPLLMTFGILGVLTTVPVMQTIGSSDSIPLIVFLLFLYLIILATYSSVSVVAKAEIFPAQIRVLGIGLPHALTVAFFGGSAEYVALWMKDIGHEIWFYWYVTFAIFLSLLTFIFMKETRINNQMDDEPNG